MRSTGARSPKSTIKTPAEVVVNAHTPPAVSGRGWDGTPACAPCGWARLWASPEPILAVGPYCPLLHRQAPSLSLQS